MRALLGINVLIALLDTDHLHHRRARDWLLENEESGWASCPFTQNGCARIMSQPGYANPLPTAAVMERLWLATRHPSHEFWPADLSLLDPRVGDRLRIHGPKQITDLYLLALAIRHQGRFVTFDGAVPISAVHGAQARHLVVI